MKRKVFIGLVFVAILALTCASAALAQTTDEPAAHVGFFDWGVLATYAGATAATIAVTQVLRVWVLSIAYPQGYSLILWRL